MHDATEVNILRHQKRCLRSKREKMLSRAREKRNFASARRYFYSIFTDFIDSGSYIHFNLHIAAVI